MAKNFDAGNFLLGAAGGTLQDIQEAKKQKQDLMLALIKAGMYQPAAGGQTPNFGQRYASNLMGPNLNSQTPNLLGMNFERVTPQMQAEQIKQQMSAYGNILGNGQAGAPQQSLSLPLPGIKGGKMTVRPPSVSSTTATRVDKQAQDILDGIKKGEISPTLTGLGRTGLAGQVLALASQQGVNLKKMQTDWASTQAYAKNLNSTQQIRLNQALSSVKMSIPKLRDLSAEFDRSGWTPLNGLEIKAAITGTDPQKRDIATKYVTQINLMRDEAAQAFQAGGVPNESAFRLANEIFSPMFGDQQLNAALDQVDMNLAIRQNAISGGEPSLIGGGQGAGQGSAQSQNAGKTKSGISYTVS